MIQSINTLRASSNIPALKFTSTAEFTAAIERGVNATERIHFVEHHCSKIVSRSGNSSDSSSGSGSNAITVTGGGLPVFDHIAMGGTFDCIHNGHRKLLAYAASMCKDTLTVGITGDVMLAKKSNASMIGSFETRKNNLYNFVRTIKPDLKLNIVELSEPFGPTITEDNIQAIIVSSETIGGAVKINQVRRDKGMQPLSVVVTFRESAATLSSSFIRDFKQRHHNM
jgi:cytidyltransferase-like protein